MGKLKTVKSAAKRFIKTAHGFKRKQSFRSHILTKKSTQRKRHLRSESYVCKSDAPLVSAMLPS